jgi:hypothetical protein
MANTPKAESLLLTKTVFEHLNSHKTNLSRQTFMENHFSALSQSKLNEL